VGIGTTTPSQKLDVAGNIQFSGALMPGGNAGSPGQVLISNGPGTPPSWTTFNAGGSGISGCANCPTMYGPFVNTNGDSVASCTQAMNWKACAQACVKSTYGGFNDWRMPSLEEVIYINTQVIDHNPGACYHWTTTPYGYQHIGGSSTANGNYYVFRPSDGYWYWNSAYNDYPCRCVR